MAPGMGQDRRQDRAGAGDRNRPDLPGYAQASKKENIQLGASEHTDLKLASFIQRDYNVSCLLGVCRSLEGHGFMLWALDNNYDLLSGELWISHSYI